MIEPHSWKLARIAIVRVGATPSEFHGLQQDDVQLSVLVTLTHKDEYVGELVIATVPLAVPIRGPVLAVDQFDAQRRAAESAIEFFARTLAIERRTTHSITSPLPCFGFVTNSPATLRSVPEISMTGLKSIAATNVHAPTHILETVNLNDLEDRKDGLALLAEALASPTAFGKYTQIIRLFERAFRLGATKVVPPLSAFLQPTKHKFTHSEVDRWLTARGPSLHADKRPEIYLETDLRPFVNRMMDAAYEVLLNKKFWRDESHERREIWAAASGSSGLNEDGTNTHFVKHTDTAFVGFEMSDPFWSYPMQVLKGTASLLPEGLWLTDPQDHKPLRIAGLPESTRRSIVEAGSRDDTTEVPR